MFALFLLTFENKIIFIFLLNNTAEILILSLSTESKNTHTKLLTPPLESQSIEGAFSLELLYLCSGVKF